MVPYIFVDFLYAFIVGGEELEGLVFGRCVYEGENGCDGRGGSYHEATGCEDKGEGGEGQELAEAGLAGGSGWFRAFVKSVLWRLGSMG